MAGIESRARFEATGRILTNGLTEGLNGQFRAGEDSRFYFESAQSTRITVEPIALPGFFDRLEIRDFVSVYAPQLKQAAVNNLGDNFEAKVSILSACIESFRLHAVAESIFEDAVNLRSAALKTFPTHIDYSVSGPPKYVETAALAADTKARARIARYEFESLHAALSQTAGITAPQEVQA